jgi:DNA-binding NarL/FixJ family response regulator
MNELSPRQMEVTKLVARGMTNQQIANKLEISFCTVRAHVSAALNRTGSPNRAALAYWLNSGRTK